jgi:hypothetical protein
VKNDECALRAPQRRRVPLSVALARSLSLYPLPILWRNMIAPRIFVVSVFCSAAPPSRDAIHYALRTAHYAAVHLPLYIHGWSGG